MNLDRRSNDSLAHSVPLRSLCVSVLKRLAHSYEDPSDHEDQQIFYDA